MMPALFDGYPTYDHYRTLKDVTPAEPPMFGEDGYALQCAINFAKHAHNPDLVTDGSIGPATGEAIWQVQEKLGIVVDGKAGQETQRALALYILNDRLDPWTTRYLLVQGIILKESSFWLGNYSAKRDDGNYDAGVTQQNTEHHDVAEAFNPVQAIAYLTAHTLEGLGLYKNRALYLGGDHSRRRRHQLAAGRWNAPYYANHLAGIKPDAIPGTTARSLLEAYMAEATKLLRERP